MYSLSPHLSWFQNPVRLIFPFLSGQEIFSWSVALEGGGGVSRTVFVVERINRGDCTEYSIV